MGWLLWIVIASRTERLHGDRADRRVHWARRITRYPAQVMLEST
jgi:hypothetical protein